MSFNVNLIFQQSYHYSIIFFMDCNFLPADYCSSRRIKDYNDYSVFIFVLFSRVLLSLVVNSFRNADFDSIERFWDANLATQSRGICQAVGQIKHVQLFLQKRGKGKDKPHSGTSGQKQSVTQFLTSKGTATHDWVIEGSQFEIWSASFSIRKQKPMMTQFS